VGIQLYAGSAAILRENVVKDHFCRRWTYIFFAIAMLANIEAQATPPTPTDSTGNAMGLLPGTFPTTVTAANLTIEQGTPAVMNGTGQNLIKITYPASGPIKWTDSRANEGDVSLLIGPGNPNDSSYYPSPTFHDNYAPISNGPFENSTIGWRLNQQTGAALATVRHNGVDYGPDYTFNGSPVGKVHGIAYFNQTGASGWGYRMNDGQFANGGNGSTDLQMGYAGYDAGQGEGNSSAAVAYFPYEQGWKGAWVNSGTDGEATFAASSPGLPTSSVIYTGTVAKVTLPGVNSATDGMLFVAPTHDDNRTNIAAAYPTGGGWSVAVREDDGAIFSGDASSLVPGGENQFQFLYVPYSAPRLIGGQVNGATGAMIHAVNDPLFDVARTAEGKYAVSVYAANGVTKLTENDGMLIMSVSGSNASNLADRKFLSYQYNSGTGNFDVESREDVAILQPTPPSENQFGDELALRDVNFYFAWVSFSNPLAPSLNLTGDYNNNGVVDAADYVAWRNAGPTDTLPNDATPGTVDQSDYQAWRANFGAGSGSGAGLGGSQSVPEPTSIALVCLLGSCLLPVRVRR
jgi:hypothetical protein